eukprot:scaffold18208_cov51-Isochrysis_galbana.AAC.1
MWDETTPSKTSPPTPRPPDGCAGDSNLRVVCGVWIDFGGADGAEERLHLVWCEQPGEDHDAVPAPQPQRLGGGVGALGVGGSSPRHRCTQHLHGDWRRGRV